MSLLELFCHVDDFCRAFVPEWQQVQLASGAICRNRARSLGLSEIMTILIWFQCSGYRNFKTYYQAHVQQHLRSEFPTLVSYSRFVEFTPSALLPLLAYLRTCLGSCTGVSFLDTSGSPKFCMQLSWCSCHGTAELRGRLPSQEYHSAATRRRVR